MPGRQIPLVSRAPIAEGGLRAPPRVHNPTAKKSLAGEFSSLTVPQTDTGRRGEKPKVLE